MPRFQPSAWGMTLSGHYPDQGFRHAGGATKIAAKDITRFVRLWMTEGIPFCFENRPMVYENLREYVANTLNVDPRDVSLVGSARLGFSLSPQHFLREFVPGQSDLDLFVVSDRVFKTLSAEYDTAITLWKSGAVSAGAKKEADLRKIEATVARHRRRGFIDSNQIPSFRPRYVPELKLTCDVMLTRLIASLMELDFVPRFHHKNSVRVYSRWDNVIVQNSLSLTLAISSLPAPSSASPNSPAAS